MTYIDSIDDYTFSISKSVAGTNKTCYPKTYAARSVSVSGESEPRVCISGTNINTSVIMLKKYSDITVDGDSFGTAELAIKAINTQLGALLNPSPPPSGGVPDGAIVTLNGDYIKTMAGDYIVAGGSQIPNNALVTLNGDYIKTLNNDYITI